MRLRQSGEFLGLLACFVLAIPSAVADSNSGGRHLRIANGLKTGDFSTTGQLAWRPDSTGAFGVALISIGVMGMRVAS